jgi:predicted ATPase/DNA-binding CsgD family transcriptional regulator
VSGSSQGNVVVPPATLVGRDELLESLGGLLRPGRLVTLTGSGGVGKTRLATAVAASVAPDFPDGTWMVELGAVTNPDVVSDAVASTLGITPQGETPIRNTVVDAVAGRRLLLVLDNCEHVLAATAELVGSLLTRSGEVAILATSREILGVVGEQGVPVPALEVGGPASAAVTLFVERARGVRPNFSLDDHPEAANAVEEICRVLDGLPLGIELAAARMAGMSVADVRDRLDERFRLLEGQPEAPRRQQSLAELVRWSYELLDKAERDALRRAAVFTGGFDLRDYLGVFDCGDDVAVLRSLDRLVRSSLLVADHADGRVRYRLLETVHQFAVDAVAATGHLEAERDRHARHFASEIMTKWDSWNGPGWRPAVDWVRDELANLRAAFRWSFDRNVETAADIAAHAALIGTSANLFEPISWAESLLDSASVADITRLPRLYAAAGYACFVGRSAAAVEHANKAMQLESLPRYDPCSPGLSAFIGALANVYDGNLDRYLDLAAAADACGGSALAFARPALVDGLQASGRIEEALALLDSSVIAARDAGNPCWLAYALWVAGTTLSKSDPQRALSAWDECLDVIAEHGVDFFGGFVARDAARLHTATGDTDAALDQYAGAIESFHKAGNVAQLIITLASVPELLDLLGRQEAAATLHAALTRIPVSVEHVPALADLGKRLTLQLGDAISVPTAAGRTMDLNDAAAYARTEIEGARASGAASIERPGGLSRREVEVLRLVADGLTTRAIAERLFISAKTADRHIQNIYTKIGTSSRATATRWAVDHGVLAATTGGHDNAH